MAKKPTNYVTYSVRAKHGRGGRRNKLAQITLSIESHPHPLRRAFTKALAKELAGKGALINGQILATQARKAMRRGVKVDWRKVALLMANHSYDAALYGR